MDRFVRTVIWRTMYAKNYLIFCYIRIGHQLTGYLTTLHQM